MLVRVVTGLAPLDWCEFTTVTRAGQLLIEQPDGPRLGADAIAWADVVLVPALAVGQHGHRLGRGGGPYDRTLVLRKRLRGDEPQQDLRIALVYNEEFPIDLPHDDLDQPVSAVVTPAQGLMHLGPVTPLTQRTASINPKHEPR